MPKRNTATSPAVALADAGAADALAALSAPTREALLDAIAYLATTRRTPWCADDVHDVLADAGIDLAQPVISGGPSAMGGAFRRCAADGLIRATGEVTTSRRPSRHGSILRLWIGREAVAG